MSGLWSTGRILCASRPMRGPDLSAAGYTPIVHTHHRLLHKQRARVAQHQKQVTKDGVSHQHCVGGWTSRGGYLSRSIYNSKRVCPPSPHLLVCKRWHVLKRSETPPAQKDSRKPFPGHPTAKKPYITLLILSWSISILLVKSG